MPRRPRIALPGVPLHIIQRGNNRSPCFYTHRDYTRYLLHLRELALRYDCDVHAFALMTNHVHMLLTPARQESASILMKHLGQRYVQYFNRTYHRSGTLWEGRFRSCIVCEEDYLLRCYRYIELNPVRAAIVSDPRDFLWSSHRFNAEGARSNLLVPHPCYLSLGRTGVSRRTAYRNLFDEELDPSMLDQIRRATNGNVALGSGRFRRQIERALGSRAGRGRTGRPPRSNQDLALTNDAYTQFESSLRL